MRAECIPIAHFHHETQLYWHAATDIKKSTEMSS